MFGCCMGDRGGGEGYYDDDSDASDASSCSDASDASDSRGGFKGISSRRKGGRKKGRRRKGKKPRRTVELDERRTAGQRSRADLEAESERRMREIDARMLRQQGEHEERAQERIDNLRLRAQAEHDKLAQQLRHTQLELQLEHERAERAKVELAQKQATFDQLEAERQAYFDSLEKVKNNIGADVGHLQDELRTKAEEEKARLANEVSRAKDELTAEHDKFVAAQTQLEAKRREAQEHEAKHKADMDAHEAKWREEHDREEQLRKELEAKAKADHDQLKKEVNALHKDLEREHEKTAEAWSAVNEKQATIECLEAEHEAAMANLETKLREEQQELEARIKSNQERLEREAEAARGELLKEQEKTAREKDQRERFEREVSESKALLAAAQSAEAEAKAKAEEAAAAANQQARKAAADAKRKAEKAAAAAAQRQAEEAATAAATRQAAAAPQHANHRDGAPAAAGSDAAARRSGHSQGGADASVPSGAAAATASAPDDPGISSEERAKVELKAVQSLEDSIPKCENTFLFKHAADLGSLTSDGAGDSDAVIERWEGAPGLLTKVEGCEAALRELDEAILAAEACAPNSTGGFRSNAAGNDLRSKADALSKSLSGSIATAQSAAARWEKNAVLGLRDSIAACKATEMYANMVRSKLGETKPESSDASSTVQMGGALTLLVLVERCEVAVDGLDQAIRDAERCAPVGSSGFRFESKGGDLKTEAQTLSAELCAAIEDAQAAATSAEAKAEAKAAAAARGMPDVLQWTLQNRRLALSLIDEEVPETLKFTKKERNSLMEAGDTPQWIYVEDKEHGYIPAKVTGHHEGKPLRGRKRRSLEVVSANGRHFDVDVDVEGGKEIVQQIEDPSTLAMIPDDLADTVGLNEGTLLHHLRARFHHDHFYTSLGHVLISINPFKWNKLLYAKDVIQFYVDNRQLGMRERSLPPHTFAVAERAFLAIAQRDARNQSIIISGESGAGKTEVAKQCLAYLAAVSMARKKKTKKTDDGSVAAKQDKFSKSKKSRKMQSTRSLLMMGYAPGVSSKLVDKIVLANPILEAFGNAKTLRNSNSSRFGKWLIVHYDDGHSILGCANKVYLLEKSRVTFQSQGERNFHVFYLLLEGADEDMRESLCLSREALEKAPHADAPSDSESLCAWFHYVNQSGVFALGGKHDEKAHYDELIHSLETLQFDEDSIQQIFNCVAAILHLGNVSFVSTDTNGPNQASKDGCRVTDESKPWLETAAKLLGVPCDGANGLGVWLCRHKMHNKGRAGQPASLILIGHKPEKAANVRDATAKALYSKLFLWLVERINVSAGPEDVSKSQNFIGLLDIFGFEVFEKNGFDQLCINYANEKLQLLFNESTFSDELALYTSEGITEIPDLELPDNSKVIAIIGGGRSSILRLLDDENKLRERGSDHSFFRKMLKEHASGGARGRPKKGEPPCVVSGDERRGIFTIQHFAGSVSYTPEGFVKRNADSYSEEISELFAESKGNAVLAELYHSELAAPADESVESKQSRFGGGDVGRKSNRPKDKTVAKVFRRDIDSLAKDIGPSIKKTKDNPNPEWSTDPHFIRCIKGNNAQKPGVFEDKFILKQLRCAGIPEAGAILRSGYPFRSKHHDFREEHKSYLPKEFVHPEDDADWCRAFVKYFVTVVPQYDGAIVGKTMVLCGGKQKFNIDSYKHKLFAGAVHFQALVRGYLARNAKK